MGYPVTQEAIDQLCRDIERFREKAGMAEHSVKKEQLISWKILKQKEGQLLATNAYALLTSDYFPFSKTQCAVLRAQIGQYFWIRGNLQDRSIHKSKKPLILY